MALIKMILANKLFSNICLCAFYISLWAAAGNVKTIGQVGFAIVLCTLCSLMAIGKTPQKSILSAIYLICETPYLFIFYVSSNTICGAFFGFLGKGYDGAVDLGLMAFILSTSSWFPAYHWAKQQRAHITNRKS